MVWFRLGVISQQGGAILQHGQAHETVYIDGICKLATYWGKHLGPRIRGWSYEGSLNETRDRVLEDSFWAIRDECRAEWVDPFFISSCVRANALGSRRWAAVLLKETGIEKLHTRHSFQKGIHVLNSDHV